MRIDRFCSSVLFLAAISGTGVQAQPTAPWPKDVEAAFDTFMACAKTSKAVPGYEEIAGRKFPVTWLCGAAMQMRPQWIVALQNCAGMSLFLRDEGIPRESGLMEYSGVVRCGRLGIWFRLEKQRNQVRVSRTGEVL
jgi:hypothetical protein